MPDGSVAIALLAYLALPYALVLAAPGPNLLVMMSVGLAPASRRPFSVALGIASGAMLAAAAAAVCGAHLVGAGSGFHAAGTLVVAAIVARSGVRLLSAPLATLDAGPGRAASRGGLRPYAAGLVVALSNPMTLPFFVSAFASQPLATTAGGAAMACLMVFAMAGLWFSALGLCLARSGLAGAPRLGARLRRLLGVAMIGFAVLSVARLIAT